VLHGLGLADVCFIGVEPGPPPRPSLAEEIPALIESYLDRLKPRATSLVKLSSSFGFAQAMLFVRELVDTGQDVLVLHRVLRS
jgi:hypothetical protein